MTFEEKLKEDTDRGINGFGCPSDHGYEERPSFYTHCASTTCKACWNREMEEKENGNMKYKAGDTVLIQGVVTEVDEDSENSAYKLTTKVSFDAFSGSCIWLSEDELFELPKQDKTYEQGLEDAWELARKLYEMKLEKLQEVFGGFETELEVIQHLTPQEALAKLKAYEEESEIKVGDVVSNGTHVLLCVKEDYGYGYFYFLDKDGSHIFLTKENLKKSKFTKTGKHIDIESLLEQIKGDANE